MFCIPVMWLRLVVICGKTFRFPCEGTFFEGSDVDLALNAGVCCVLVQDVAIAYGYNNITRTLPKSHTQGKQQSVNHLSDLIRAEVTLSPVGMHFYLFIETNLSCPVLASISVVLRLLNCSYSGPVYQLAQA